MDVEKTIQFLLEQSAATDARIAELAARQAEADAQRAECDARHERWKAEIEAKLTKLTNSQESIIQTQARQLLTIDRLVESVAETRATLNETGERLNALVAIVDGLVRRNQ